MEVTKPIDGRRESSSSSSTTVSSIKSDFKTENGKLSFTDLDGSLLSVTSVSYTHLTLPTKA